MKGPTPREVLASLLVAGVVATLLLGEALFGGKTVLSFDLVDPRLDIRPWVDAERASERPFNPVTPDMDLYVLPGLMRVRQLREAGIEPLWDDAQLLGYPLAGNLPYPLFSPIARALEGLGPVAFLEAMLWVHLVIAGALGYLATRELGAGAAASAFGAVGFALSAWMWTRWHLPHIFYASVWWPALVIGACRWRRGDVARGVGIAAAGLGLSLLCGFPQVSLAFVGALAVLALLERRPRAALAIGAVVVLGVAVSWPQQNLLRQAYDGSARASEATRRETGRHGLAPAALATLLLPDFFGRPADFTTPEAPAPTMEAWLPHRRWLFDDAQENPVENAVYLGLLVLLLLPAVLARDAPADARRLAVVAVLALLGCLLWSPLVAWRPEWAGIGAGNVKRGLVLWAACAPFAAALVLDRLARAVSGGGLRTLVPWAALLIVGVALAPWLASTVDDPAADRFAKTLVPQVSRQWVLLAAGIAAVVFARRRGVVGVWLAAAVLAIDLGGAARAFNPFPPQREPFPTQPVIEALAARTGRSVVYESPNLLPPPAAALHGLRSVHGVAPMVPVRTVELLGVIEGPLFDVRDPRVARPLREPESLSHPLLDLLAVDTVVHADPELAERSGLPVLLVDVEAGLGALSRPSAGPAAFVTGGARVVRDADARLTALGDRNVRPHATAWLEREPPFALPETGAWRAAEVLERAPGRWRLETDAPFDGVLVVTEAFDPAWSVRVDGEARVLEPVDHALMGLPLAAGSHRVELDYAPTGRTTARVVAGVGWVAIVATLVAGFARRRRGRDTDQASDGSLTAGA